jgi:hypothetical protein
LTHQLPNWVTYNSAKQAEQTCSNGRKYINRLTYNAAKQAQQRYVICLMYNTNRSCCKRNKKNKKDTKRTNTTIENVTILTHQLPDKIT